MEFDYFSLACGFEEALLFVLSCRTRSNVFELQAMEAIRDVFKGDCITYHGGLREIMAQGASYESEMRGSLELIYSIKHPNAEKNAANRRIFDGIAAVLDAHPNVELDIVGMGDLDGSLMAIGNHLQLDPEADRAKIQSRVWALRSSACLRALAERADPEPVVANVKGHRARVIAKGHPPFKGWGVPRL